MDAQPTLLCIPDISGFTHFMGEIDFELSSKVIPALLNQIIYSNEIELKVSEIEGDAVLFYRNGDLPTLATLFDQCQYFYSEFYRRMAKLRRKHNGHNAVKKIPEILGLKVILHFGKEVGLVSIGKNIKLIGEEVVTAHRLLKNNIALEEYVLISEELLSQYDKSEIDYFEKSIELQTGHVHADHLGKIAFKYAALNQNRPLFI